MADYAAVLRELDRKIKNAEANPEHWTPEDIEKLRKKAAEVWDMAQKSPAERPGQGHLDRAADMILGYIASVQKPKPERIAADAAVNPYRREAPAPEAEPEPAPERETRPREPAPVEPGGTEYIAPREETPQQQQLREQQEQEYREKHGGRNPPRQGAMLGGYRAWARA